MSRLWWLLVAALVGSPPLWADEPLVVLPSGDYVCAVEVTPHQLVQPDPSHPEGHYAPTAKKILITRVGKIRRSITFWSDNTVSRAWDLLDKNLCVLVSNHPTKDLYVLKGRGRDAAYPGFLLFDPDSVSWITNKALDESSKGGPTLHYQADIPFLEEGGPPHNLLYQAWINPATRLPVKFDDSNALYSLTFSFPATQAPLVLPDEVVAELNRWQAAMSPRRHL